jgi:hypothetical protein
VAAVAGAIEIEQSASRWLDTHSVAWAAAYAVLAQRAMGVRPSWRRPSWEAFLRHDFRSHCLPDYDAVAAVVAGVPCDAPLRPLIGDTKWLAGIPSMSIDERLAMHRRQAPDLPPEN